MNHLIISREYPPCAYPQGGIGTYVVHVARLLAERGETVHIIGEQWPGAPLARDVSLGGRLIVHRVPLGQPLPLVAAGELAHEQRILDGMLGSELAPQAFSWQVARLTESLIEREAIDCIEAQEFESPLYYFLLRRALGYGPRRQPPCFVHLHSPAQFIFHHNDWEIGRPGHLTMKRFEDYVIKASDAALCPSHYLARQVERHYGLPHLSITRIPYPKGDTARLDRTNATWASGTICYFGRMEGRKGVFEWIDAAVAVARERPGLTFELIGSDTSVTGAGSASVREALAARVPDDVRSAISILDAMPRDRLIERLRLARVAVVPSRWENFPNTCVEAMSTGLPVLASPEGGMAEMLEDGRTGWLADSVEPQALAAALRRALDTPAEQKAAMGLAASEAIRTLCDNRRTIDEQIEFRKALAARGADRSLRLPVGGSNVIWTDAKDTASRDAGASTEARVEATPETNTGLAVVVTGQAGESLDGCVTSILEQTQRPAAIVISAPGIPLQIRQQTAIRCTDAGLRVISLPDVLQPGSDAPLAIAFVDAGCRLKPEFIASVLPVLSGDSGVGVVSSWYSEAPDHRLIIRPRPQRPYQWTQNDTSPCTAFRVRALRDIAWVFDMPAGHPSVGDMSLAVLLDGWSGVTVPRWLGSREHSTNAMHQALAAATRTRLMPILRTRFVNEIAEDVPQLLDLVERTPERVAIATVSIHHSPTPLQVLRLPFRTQVQLARQALRDPGAAARWVVGHGRQIIRRNLGAKW